MCLFFSFPSLLLRSSSTLKSKLERLWSVPSFKDIAMRTDLLDSNYLHKDGVLRVSSQSTYYPSFYKKKYSAARGLLFIFLWCPFYFARLIGFFSFLWFVHVLVIVLKRLHIGIWFEHRNFFYLFPCSLFFCTLEILQTYFILLLLLPFEVRWTPLKNLPFDYAWIFSKIFLFRNRRNPLLNTYLPLNIYFFKVPLQFQYKTYFSPLHDKCGLWIW